MHRMRHPDVIDLIDASCALAPLEIVFANIRGMAEIVHVDFGTPPMSCLPDMEGVSFSDIWKGLMISSGNNGNIDQLFTPKTLVWEHKGVRVRMRYLPKGIFHTLTGSEIRGRKIELKFG